MKNQKMKKKTTKGLESLKKFQVKNEGKKDVTGGSGGPTYNGPIQATTRIGDVTCNMDISVDTPDGPIQHGWGDCHN